MLASSSGPYLVRHPWCANSSRLSEPQKSNLLVRRLVSTLLTFFQISQKPPRASEAWRHSHSVTRFVSDYCDISEWHVRPARALTPASSLHLTNPKGMNRNPLAITLQLIKEILQELQFEKMHRFLIIYHLDLAHFITWNLSSTSIADD